MVIPADPGILCAEGLLSSDLVADFVRTLLLPLGPDCVSAYERFYTDAEASAAYGGPITAAAAASRLASDIGSWFLQGFGVWSVSGRMRSPRPAARIIAFKMGEKGEGLRGKSRTAAPPPFSLLPSPFLGRVSSFP